jgi:N-acetylglucosaminyl-diphospho-decaprenol L-rhamnosyltransferase
VDRPQLSAVIPTFNGGRLLDRCLDALEKAEVVEEVLVLDGGSQDGSPERAEGRRGVRVLSFPGRSFQWRLNHGMREARSEFVLHLNDDAFVDPETPERLLEVMRERPGVAASGAGLRYEDGRPQRSVAPYRTLLNELLDMVSLRRLGARVSAVPVPHRREAGVDEAAWLPLCCAVLRRSAFLSVGGFDERFSFYYDDQDFCRRLVEGGWSLVVRWDAGAVHVGGGATQAKDPARWFRRFHHNRLLYLRKHYPGTWRAFAALWPVRALLHVTLWRLRAVRARLRGDPAAEQEAHRWADAFGAAMRSSRPDEA